MSIGIIFCETLKSEIEFLSRNCGDISRLKKMPWRLHINPDQLLSEIDREIKNMQDDVKVIVLGYGRCQAMDRLGDNYNVPVLRPEAEDCIGILLGQQRYEDEINKIPGTWFLSPGWTRMGTDFVFQELQLDRVGHKEIDPLKFARRMLDGFSRALFIRLQAVDEIKDLRPLAQKIANDLDLQLEETEGSFSELERVLCEARDIVKK